MATIQTFLDSEDRSWEVLEALPGVELDALTQLPSLGSVHRARLSAGTVVPAHTHPCDEHVYVLRGQVTTGGRSCKAGTFWSTPAGTRQGPHVAVTEVELLTVRLGPMGEFEPGSPR